MRLDKAIDDLQADLVAAVQEAVRIRSVKEVEQAAPGAPFGPGIRKALDWFLALGERLGFTVKDVDGYAGYVELGSGELFGILGHLDVVPEGDGWTVPPYEGLIKEGKIYGRGAVDDKGPTLAALFAMKVLKDSGLPLTRRVRLIAGTDEESGWADMAHYAAKEEVPACGFAPDAEFPVIHAEKGILHLELSKPVKELPHLVLVDGGVRPNMVPDKCRVHLSGLEQTLVASLLQSFDFPGGVHAELLPGDGRMAEFVVHGIGAHGSLPERGKNAVLYALSFLQALPLHEGELELLQWLLAYPGKGWHGEGFGLALQDEPSGKMSVNVGMLHLEAGQLSCVLDIRYPVTFRPKDVLDPIERQARIAGFKTKVVLAQAPHHVPQDSALVQGLLRAYHEVSGREAYAFAIGGGTYAKVMPQGVAFGPSFPGEPELVHCPDEYITINNLLLTAKIYAQALVHLATGEAGA